MPFPDSQRLVFERNPLAQVICQLRFPPILSIASQEPAEFQERIRADYPLYEAQEAIAVPTAFAEMLRGLSLPGPILVGHNFSTENRSRSITINRDFLAVEERSYQRWERFVQELEQAKTALEQVYKPAFYSRVGLRYVNIIDREQLGLPADDPWEALLKPALVGMLGTRELRDEISEINGLAQVRLHEVEQGAARISFGLRPRSPGSEVDHRQVFIIDADLFTETRQLPADVIPILNEFNTITGRLFRWAITDRLRDALRPKPLD